MVIHKCRFRKNALALGSADLVGELIKNVDQILQNGISECLFRRGKSHL